MFAKNGDVPYTELGGGLRRKILSYDEKMMAVEVSFDEGAIGAMHSHPHSQISYVLSGKFEATVDGVTKIIEAGDTYVTSPNTPHGVVCIEKGVLLDVFAPMRKDFIK